MLSSHELCSQSCLLDSDLHWLKSSLMPLFNGYFESILAQPLNSSNELAQRAVTLLVEPAVVEKLVECLLFASLEHPFEREEHNFADEELVVVSVVAVHGSLFNGNFGYTVVVSAI